MRCFEKGLLFVEKGTSKGPNGFKKVGVLRGLRTLEVPRVCKQRLACRGTRMGGGCPLQCMLCDGEKTTHQSGEREKE